MKNIGILMSVLMLWVAGAIQAVGADTNVSNAVMVNASSNVVVSDTFDEWEWVPIIDSMRQPGRKVLEAGGQLPYEYEGPLFRQAKGFYLPAGRMVEGPEAYKGCSMLLDASRGRLEVGLHDRYSGLFEPGKTYAYELALKGKGKFLFQGWVSGVDPATAQYKWLEFPAFIAVPVTNEWKVYTGSFTVKKYDDTPFKVGKISAAIVVGSNDVICLDDFKISR